MTTDHTDHTAIDLRLDPTNCRLNGVTRHGNQRFDVPYVSEITEGFWQGGCAAGLILPSHFKHVISLYPWEWYDVRHDLDSFTEIRMYDSEGDVNHRQVTSIAQWVNACRSTGTTLLNCQAGLNRSGLVAAVALILEGMSPVDAVKLLRFKRSNSVLCNRSFEKFVLDYPVLDDAFSLKES